MGMNHNGIVDIISIIVVVVVDVVTVIAVVNSKFLIFIECQKFNIIDSIEQIPMID